MRDGRYRENPRYNHVQTRLTDSDYAALQQMSAKFGTSPCKTASALIKQSLKVVAV